MEVFQDVEFVRLRSRVDGKYLLASEDGRSVHLAARHASYRAVWAVETIHAAAEGGGDGVLLPGHVLLRGAYGRYLGAPDAISHFWAPCCCWPAVGQRDFDDRDEVNAIVWRPVGLGAAAGDGVVLLHDKSDRYLRVNERWLPFLAGVAAFNNGDLNMMMQWEVLPVPTTLFRRDLPAMGHRFDYPPSRKIQWVIADNSGSVDEDNWSSMEFAGRSVRLLIQDLDALQLTLCIRAGSHGRLTPLLINLPRSWETLHVVFVRPNTAVLNVNVVLNTRGHNQLRFPDMDADVYGYLTGPSTEGSGYLTEVSLVD
uniref:Uncharacterized protein n=1 Tax=Oryza punctata TaxID=4537 RepID=A0A0E0LRM1_ORYPU